MANERARANGALSDEEYERKMQLVSRMMNAYFAASGTPYSYPSNMVAGMEAALQISSDALLAQRPASYTREQVEAALDYVLRNEFHQYAAEKYRLIHGVLDRLQPAPKTPKTPEERRREWLMRWVSTGDMEMCIRGLQEIEAESEARNG
jgi:hypothetical protein